MDIKNLSAKLKLAGLEIKLLDIQTLITSSNEGQRLYFIDKQDNLHKTIIYKRIDPIDRLGLAVIEKDNKKGLIRLNTEEIIKPLYDEVKVIEDDNKDSELQPILVVKDSSLTGIYDLNLNHLIPTIYRSIESIMVIKGHWLINLINKTNENVLYEISENQSYKLDVGLKLLSHLSSEDFLVGLEYNDYVMQLYDIVTKEKRTIESYDYSISRNCVRIQLEDGTSYKFKALKNYYK